jgi:hypothetical protein
VQRAGLSLTGPCRCQGNGKTLRTVRAMKAFPDNWSDAAGPSSSKAGMTGQSDASNGKNLFYDEIFSEITENEGDRLEYWK